MQTANDKVMASITIRNLDSKVKTQLRIRAAGHGRSMEEEARMILREAVEREEGPKNLAQAIRSRLHVSAVWSWTCRRVSQCANHPGLSENTGMFVLDTNVISELMRPTPNPVVVDWVAGHTAANLFFSAVERPSYAMALLLCRRGGGETHWLLRSRGC